MFEEIRDNAELLEVSLDDVLPYQANLQNPTNRMPERDDFYKNIDDEEFIQNLKVGLQLKERVKEMLPKWMIIKIKSRVKK